MKLELRGISVQYGRGHEVIRAVDGVDLAVGAGETVGLVGESGCGKSTIARAIVGLVPTVSGQILLAGEDFTSTSKRNSAQFRRRVQMIFQDPYSSLSPRMKIGDMLEEAIAKTRKVERQQRRAVAVELLEMVGMPSRALENYPHQFSGGQRQRLSIARALAVRPEVIIHDEVTSALDVSVQGAILNLLRELQKELGLAYIFISHDLSTVRYMSNRVSVMYLGRVVESAPTLDLFQSPSHPYTSALIRSIPQVGAHRVRAPLSGDLPDPQNPPQGCRFHSRCPVGPLTDSTRSICVEEDPQAVAALKVHKSACHFARAATAVELASAVDPSTLSHAE